MSLFTVSNVGLDVGMFARLTLHWPPAQSPEGSVIFVVGDRACIVVAAPSGGHLTACDFPYHPFKLDVLQIIRGIDAFNEQLELFEGTLRVAL